MTRRIGLIGFGSIGQSIVSSWNDAEVPGNRLVVLLARHRQLEGARKAVRGDVVVTDAIDEFVGQRPDIAIEAAGQSCVLELGPLLLSQGIDLMLLSVGSLADRDVSTKLRSAAQDRARILIPVGAIAGLDGLLALRRAGLERVTYISAKPPASWLSTPADGPFDLLALTERTVIFQGTAREAATQFPKNANLAAAVALAGLGFDDTRVELVADPNSVENVGRIEAEAATSKLSVVVAGRSAPGNPKTSQITGMSVLSALANSSALLAFE
jgi:aspartate dehydrogenase